MQKAIKKSTSSITLTPSTPRTIVTRSNSNKWKGCVYISAFEMSGQILNLLNSISSDYNGALFNNPVFVFTSKNKNEVETKINNKLKSIFKTKN